MCCKNIGIVKVFEGVDIFYIAMRHDRAKSHLPREADLPAAAHLIAWTIAVQVTEHATTIRAEYFVPALA